MTTRTTGIFFGVLLTFITPTPEMLALAPGQTVALKLTDVDGRSLSASDGQVTTLVFTARRDLDKARVVGDRTPDRCLGNPKFRMITVIHFSKTTSRTMRFVFTKLVRQRLASEANRLRPRYLAKKLATDPRQDVHVVTDFNGATASQLGLPDSSELFKVLILAPDGVLLREWNAVPTSQELDSALR